MALLEVKPVNEATCQKEETDLLAELCAERAKVRRLEALVEEYQRLVREATESLRKMGK